MRSADHLYVADASLPGLRVISIQTITTPVTVATYTSIDGPIHDLTLWGTRMVLAVDDAFVVLDVTRGEHPAFRRLGS